LNKSFAIHSKSLLYCARSQEAVGKFRRRLDADSVSMSA
jgi:hypothetical protein